VRIYLDDCSDSNRLANFLQQAGHIVQNPRGANIMGADDPVHLEYAAQNQYVLMTQNPNDFLMLHYQWQQQNRSHSGIFLVYKENDVTRDMSYRDIVRAINRLIASGLPIDNQVHNLNQWR
jgi:hypothetical protein